MATESVKILIEAEDQASAKIAAASKEVENRIKNIKDVGGKAKASTEFIGTLANTLGGSELSSYASQLAGLTEKVGQFSEVSKVGGAGAMAFKAGLAGVVGVLSFQVGNALGNMIFETDKWNKELEKSIELSKKMSAELNRLADVRMGDALADIQFLEDPEKQIEQIRKLSNEAGKEVSSLAARIEALKNEQRSNSFDKDADIFGGAFASMLNKTRNAEVIREIEDLTDKKEKANARALALDKQAGDATRQIEKDKLSAIRTDEKYLESLDKQIAMLQAVKEDSKIDLQISLGASGIEKLQKEIESLEQRKVNLATQEQAKQNTSGLVSDEGGDAAKEAESKLTTIKLIEKQIELEKLQREEKKAALKEIADLEFNSVMAAEKAFIAERDRLAEQKVLLEQGAEAAHAMRLAKQGITEEDAKSFAAQQAELDNQKQVQEKMKARESAQPLQAVSSRFLTRGPVDDKMLDVAKSQLKVQQEQLAELKKPKPEGPKMRDVRLVEVG